MVQVLHPPETRLGARTSIKERLQVDVVLLRGGGRQVQRGGLQAHVQQATHSRLDARAQPATLTTLTSSPK